MVKEDYEEECVGRWKAPKVRDGALKMENIGSVFQRIY